MVCEIFPDQGLNLCPLRWQVDSYLLDYQGSLPNSVFMGKKHQSFRPVILGIYSHIRVSLSEQNHRDLWEGTIKVVHMASQTLCDLASAHPSSIVSYGFPLELYII